MGFLLIGSAFGQEVPAAAAKPPVEPDLAREYAAMLARVRNGDTTVNFRQFRVDAVLMAGESRADRLAWHGRENADRASFKRLMDAGNADDALRLANEALERNYASVYLHIDAMTASQKLGKTAEASLHQRIAAALLDSIQRSGDGKSPGTAYFVATIPEEYALLAYRLHLNRELQAIKIENGHAYDRLDVVDPKTSETQTIWFNTDVDLGLYKRPVPWTPEFVAKFQKASQTYIHGQLLNALPMIEEIANGAPENAGFQMILADCLWYKANIDETPEESLASRDRGLAAAHLARQLGDNSARLSEILAALEKNWTGPRQFSINPDANRAMRAAELALGHGDYDGALTAYTAALGFDPSLRVAALYAGDMYVEKRDMAKASEWFQKALSIRPESADVYSHWAGGFAMQGQMAEAHEKYIDAVIALPSSQNWAALANCLGKMNRQLSHPKIELPRTQNATGENSTPWSAYWTVRAAWRQSTFLKQYPTEKEYRHSLGEEAAALTAVTDAVQSKENGGTDPQFAGLTELRRGGYLEAWILFNAADTGIARDYVSYRAGNRQKLREYIELYAVKPK